MKAKFTQLISIVLLVTMGACRSAEKMIVQGNFDGAILKSIKKLDGNHRQKRKAIHSLEEAYIMANQKDMLEIARLESQQNNKKWIPIQALYAGLIDRQQMVIPFVSELKESGYRISTEFEDLNSKEQYARENAALYLYDRAKSQMLEAQQLKADATSALLWKPLAKDAVSALNRVQVYFSDFYDTNDLIIEAQDMAHERFALQVDITDPFTQALVDPTAISYPVFELNNEDRTIYKESNIEDDYIIRIEIDQLNMSAERLYERELVEEKKILDGWEYVYDQNGNVAKDSLGNDIKQDRYQLIRARVNEVEQIKVGDILAHLDIIDARTGQLLVEKQIATALEFENIFAEFRGDRKALSPRSCELITGSFIPFPDDRQMADDLTIKLGAEIREILSKKIRTLG